MRRAWMVAALVAMGACAAPSVAEAQLTVGGHLGYGVGLNSTPDPYRGLFGVRSGWNFGEFYLGGQVSFYTGEKVSARTGDSSFRQLQVLGVDAGYDIDLSYLWLRPVFGLGGAVALRDIAGRNRNEGAAFLNFGAEVFSKLIKNKAFVGGGMRITSTFFELDNINAFSFYVMAGTRFDFSGDGKGIRLGESAAPEPPTSTPAKPSEPTSAADGDPAPSAP